MSRKNVQGSTITDLIPVFPRADAGGIEPPVWNFPELGAETFLQGTAVALSGILGSQVGLTTMGGKCSGGILGFAADNASGATSSIHGVWIATDTDIFVGNIGHSATSAASQTAASDWGQWYGLTTLSGRTYVDKAGGSGATAIARVVGLYPQDDVPCFYGRVYFTINGILTQFANYNVSGNPVQ